MDSATAEIVLYGITAIGAVVWCFGLRFLLNSRRPRRTEPADRYSVTKPPPNNVLQGSAQVEGKPEELAVKAAASLAQGIDPQVGPLKISERSDERVAFEGLGPGGQLPGQIIRQGEIRFRRASEGKTDIEYKVEISLRPWLLIGGVIFQILGLIALVLGFLLIHLFVVQNQDPDIRWQTVQMVQAVHFLWPPFLFGGLYKMQHRIVSRAFDTLVHNLPYQGV
jgi:hypothetical protein